MADTGAPGFIPLFGDSDPITPIQTPLNAHATALNTAIINSAFSRYAAASSLPTTGNLLGQHATVYGDVASKNGDYIWNGTTWVGSMVATQFASSSPTATVNTPTSGSAAPWYNIGVVNVPAGATSAVVSMNVVGLQSPSAAGKVLLSAMIGTQAGAVSVRIPGSGQSAAQNMSWIDNVQNPPAGSQYVSLRAVWATGSGVYFLNTDSFLSARVEFH